MVPPIISLTTDFGTADPYVGVMKGVILGINPQAPLVDLSHEVRPQDIPGATFVLGSAYRNFPQGTIHLVVVDPGVGSSRRGLLLDTSQARFVAPDNGVLSYVLVHGGVVIPQGEAFEPQLVSLPSQWHAYALTNSNYWRHPVSNTFHGRDIFAPVAAHLSRGVSPTDLGEPIDQLTCLSIPTPQEEGCHINGHIIYVDHFGNLVSNIPGAKIEGRTTQVQVEIGGHSIQGLAPSYADAPEELLALVGSHGNLEVSVRNGSAAETLGLTVGAEVRVRGL